jgi:hypothetical protein
LEDLVSVGADLTENSAQARITWLGIVNCETKGTGFKIYIPKRVWMPSDIIKAQMPYKAPGFMEEVRGRESQQLYYIFNIPSLSRELLVKTKLNEIKGSNDG